MSGGTDRNFCKLWVLIFRLKSTYVEIHTKMANLHLELMKQVARVHADMSLVTDAFIVMCDNQFSMMRKLQNDPTWYSKIKETLYIQELKPAFNVGISSENLVLY